MELDNGIVFSSEEAYDDQFCLEVPFSVMTREGFCCLKEAIMDGDKQVFRIPISEDPQVINALLEKMLRQEE